MPITQRRIASHDSFIDVTASPRDTAALYFYKQLDTFYEVALAVSKDFFGRPELYTKIPIDAPVSVTVGNERERPKLNIIQLLARFRARSGTNELIPSEAQRAEIYSPIFGSPGYSSSFDRLRDDLIDAATAFAERVFNTGEDMLRERVRTAHRPLKNYLIGVTGSSTDWSARNPLEGISEHTSHAILRDPSICAVFGILTAPSTSWPYVEDSNADKLLEQITSKLDPAHVLTTDGASIRQRLAARGAEAIAAVLDYTENSADPRDDIASLDVLITQCYTWGAAMKALSR